MKCNWNWSDWRTQLHCVTIESCHSCLEIAEILSLHQSQCERGLLVDAGSFFIIYTAINNCWSLSFHTKTVCRVKHLKFSQFAVCCVFLHLLYRWKITHTHIESWKPGNQVLLIYLVNYSKPKRFATGVWMRCHGNNSVEVLHTYDLQHPIEFIFIPTAVVCTWEECNSIKPLLSSITRLSFSL